LLPDHLESAKFLYLEVCENAKIRLLNIFDVKTEEELIFRQSKEKLKEEIRKLEAEYEQ
jgi:hypothetical protein